jgi:hypothetical protein
MIMRLMMLVGLAAALSACASDPPAGQARGAVKPLYQVDTVQVRMEGTTAVIDVKATAPTPGYTGLTLRPVQYIQAPSDGVYDFTAVGTAPTGVAPFHTQPVAFTYRWRHVGANVRGVRVHAGESAVEARLPGR